MRRLEPRIGLGRIVVSWCRAGVVLVDLQFADIVGLGSKGVEYPVRFFARDYAGNRLEFSL